MAIRNLNTSRILFTSTASDQDHNARFTPGQRLKIVNPDFQCNSQQKPIFILIIIFGAIAVFIFTVSLIFSKGQLIRDIDAKKLITIFVIILIGVVFLDQIANNISSFCDIS